MVSGDTIAAIATAPGRCGVAVIRISGPDAFLVAGRLTGWTPGESSRLPSVRIRPFRQPVQEGGDAAAAALDEGLVLAFRAPHSYTGEDVVELQCHGGSVTPRRVLAACFAAGARLARRGEFTQRAFLNGKLDYSQAESVLDLIDARTERAADAALDGLAGRRSREKRELYEDALAVSADLEHALDVDEGELPPLFLSDVLSRVTGLRMRVDAALRRLREGRLLRDGALVVLAGPPNVGKSSLMNALLAENRAIVSDIPGTTRDSIEEGLNVDGWPIRLVDTAGLRETGDAVEAEGVKRAKELVARAEIVLALSDGRAAPTATVAESRASVVSVVTKADLLAEPEKAVVRNSGALTVSARTGEGLEELKNAIGKVLASRFDASVADGLPDAGDLSALTEIRVLLADLETQTDLVLLGNGVRTAAERLGALIGATYSSDLLDNLFSRFCVGK